MQAEIQLGNDMRADLKQGDRELNCVGKTNDRITTYL